MTETRTSAQWWAETRRDEQALARWLEHQYHGEATAHARIMACAARFTEPGSRARRTLELIASQEQTHAVWIGALLAARGRTPRVMPEKTERYWERTLAGAVSLPDACGVAAHAERMRLERIRVIADDATAPDDVRAAFQRILRDEEFHARAFANLAGAEALARTRDAHARGVASLGLILLDEAV